MIKIGDMLPPATLMEFVDVPSDGCSVGPNPVDVGKAVAGKTMSVRFDSNVAPGVPLRFRPERPTETVTVGARDMIIFLAKNESAAPVTVSATFNVTPSIAGPYFAKIQCFCFTEQRLEPGEEVRMPVVYYVDPAILDDREAREVQEITLSYTFFPVDAAGADG